MSAPEAAAAILWIGATLYAVFGGADFGAGIWGLLARGERGRPARKLIDRSLTPVWEANHVWLIFCLVVLWTAFPEAFGAIMSTLYIPLCLAALGIVLRGAGFAFGKLVEGERAGRAATTTFAASSLLTPFFMGTVVGAVATGRVPAAGGGDLLTSWLAPAPLTIGVLFVATSAYLAAVFLTVDAGLHPLGRGNARGQGYGHGLQAGRGSALATDRERSGEGGEPGELQTGLARWALAAAVAAGIAAVIGLVALNADAPYVFDRLFSAALPLVIISALAGAGALAILGAAVRRIPLPGHGDAGAGQAGTGDHAPRTERGGTAVLSGPGRLLVRPLAVLAVVAIIWAWGVAQYPYLLPTDLSLTQAAAPGPTLTAVFIVFGVATAFVLPALALLYTLTQRQRLGE